MKFHREQAAASALLSLQMFSLVLLLTKKLKINLGGSRARVFGPKSSVEINCWLFLSLLAALGWVPLFLNQPVKRYLYWLFFSQS
jgi:hypothetical protein